MSCFTTLQKLVKGGVGIQLSPEFTQAHNNAEGTKVFSGPTGKSSGRFLGIQNYDDWGKQIKGKLKVFLCSIYHPVDSKEYKRFDGALPSLFDQAPRDSGISLDTM